MRITQELTSEKDDVGLALRQHLVRLSCRRDHAHRTHRNISVYLLDRLRKRNLQKTKERKRAPRTPRRPLFHKREIERGREGRTW